MKQIEQAPGFIALVTAASLLGPGEAGFASIEERPKVSAVVASRGGETANTPQTTVGRGAATEITLGGVILFTQKKPEITRPTSTAYPGGAKVNDRSHTLESQTYDHRAFTFRPLRQPRDFKGAPRGRGSLFRQTPTK